MSRRADEADAAAEAEAVDRRDHRHRAVVDGGEAVVAAAVHLGDQVARVARELLDVDAGAEAAPGRPRARTTCDRLVLAERREWSSPGAPSPSLVKRVDRRMVEQRPRRCRPDRVDRVRLSAYISSLRSLVVSERRERLLGFATIRSISSAQLGRSSITPATVPLGRTPSAGSAFDHRALDEDRRVGRHERLRARQLLAAAACAAPTQQLADRGAGDLAVGEPAAQRPARSACSGFARLELRSTSSLRDDALRHAVDLPW